MSEMTPLPGPECNPLSTLVTRRQALRGLVAAVCGLAGAGLLPGPAKADNARDLASTGHTLLLSGQPGEAVVALNEAAKADPANGWIWNLLGRAYFELGDGRRAADSFLSALRADPSDGFARMMLDILSQHPLPPAAQAKPKNRRLSHLEEEALKERQAFAAARAVPATRFICLDPGHGGPEQGVMGLSGLVEKELTLDLAKRLAAVLEHRGWRVLLSRTQDYAVPLWARGALASLYGVELFVSLHATAGLPQSGGLRAYAYAPTPSDALAQTVAESENGVLRFEGSRPPHLPVAVASGLLDSWFVRRLAQKSGQFALALAKTAPKAKSAAAQAAGTSATGAPAVSAGQAALHNSGPLASAKHAPAKSGSSTTQGTPAAAKPSSVTSPGTQVAAVPDAPPAPAPALAARDSINSASISPKTGHTFAYAERTTPATAGVQSGQPGPAIPDAPTGQTVAKPDGTKQNSPTTAGTSRGTGQASANAEQAVAATAGGQTASATSAAPTAPDHRADRAPLAVLEGVRVPAVLLELGFLTNEADEAALKSLAYRQALAEELARVLTDGLG